MADARQETLPETPESGHGPGGDPASDPVRRTGTAIETTRVDGVVAFEAIIDELRTVRSSATDMTNLLKRLGTECESAAKADQAVNAVAEAIGALHAATRAVLDRVGSEAFVTALTEAKHIFDRLSREAMQFWSLSLLTRVAIGRLNTSSFDNHGELVRDLSARLTRNCNTALGRLEEVEDLLAQMRMALQAGSGVAERLHRSILDILGQAGESRALSDLGADFATAAQDLTGQAQDALRRLVGQLQFSDEFSQRLDHVAQILDLDTIDRHDGAALATAQINAVMASQTQARNEIDGALKQLTATSELATEIFANGFGKDGTAAVESRRGMIRSAADAGSRIESHVRDAEAVIAGTKTTFDAASADFRTLRATIQETAMSAANVNILIHGRGEEFASLSFLADDARKTATDTTAIVEAFETRVSVLESLFQDDPFAPLKTAFERFEDARDNCFRLLADIDQIDITRTEAGDRAADLKKRVACAAAALSSIDTTRAALDECSATLAPTASGAVLTSTPETSAILDLYTMESERAVHRELFSEDEPEDCEADDGDDAMEDFELF